jgi:hypothetical protein
MSPAGKRPPRPRLRQYPEVPFDERCSSRLQLGRGRAGLRADKSYALNELLALFSLRLAECPVLGGIEIFCSPLLSEIFHYAIIARAKCNGQMDCVSGSLTAKPRQTAPSTVWCSISPGNSAPSPPLFPSLTGPKSAPRRVAPHLARAQVSTHPQN